MNNAVNFIIKNYKPLIISLILALLLWIVVTTDKEYTYRIEVPLKITRIAPDRVLLNPPPDKVILNVSGKGRALIGLNFYQTAINLELPEIDKTTTIDLMNYKNRFNIPRELGIEIVEILEPKNIKLEVDRYLEIKKPIKILSQVKPIPGYILLGKSLEQDSVLVAGPQSIVKQIEYVYSDSITRTDVKYPFDAEVALIEPRFGVTTVNPKNIRVHFQVEQLVERTIYNIPIQLVGVPSDMIASAAPANIFMRIKGGESIISNITADEFTVVFNFARSYEQGKMNYPVQIETPPNVSLVEAIPKTFRLQLKRKENKD